MKKLLMLLAVVAMLAISLPAYGGEVDEPAKWCECDEGQVLVYKTTVKGKIDYFDGCYYEKGTRRGYLVIEVDCNELAWASCGYPVEASAYYVTYWKEGKDKYLCRFYIEEDGITFVPVKDQFAVHIVDECWDGNAVLNGKFKRTTLCKAKRGACPGCPCYCDVAKKLEGVYKVWNEDCGIAGWGTMKARFDKKWTKRANCCIDPCDGDVPCKDIFFDILDKLENKGYERIYCCCVE